MRKLTFEYFKEKSRRYNGDIGAISRLSPSSYSVLSHGNQFRLFILSLITFCEDEELKYFIINNEFDKLTKNEIINMFGWKSFNYVDLAGSLKSLLSDDNLNLSNIEIHFIYLMCCKFYDESYKNKKQKPKNLVEHLNAHKFYLFEETKKKVATALLELDYLDYVNLEEHKKGLFEILLGIKGGTNSGE